MSSPPGHVPLPPTSFVGRGRERAAVRDLLKATRLLTLLGPGGSGKTRLAVEVAAGLRAARAFADGVWWIELAGLADPALVPHVVASALRIGESSGRPITETLRDYFHPRNLLLALDNCEHLADACADLAAQLLSACPGVHLLLTSREALGMTAERTFSVLPLSLPESCAGPLDLSPADALGYEAVQLFVERAEAVRSSFRLDEQNTRTVLHICRRLDGIPLALELAAARIRALSVEEIAPRLEDALGLLTTGDRTAPTRHQTLRAAIEWSFRLLSPGEQTLFCRLAVFAGSFTLEAAEAVCSGGPAENVIPKAAVLDLIAQLVDKSLVVLEEQAGQARYRLLEVIRQYARALTDPAEAARLQQAHCAFFLELAEATAPRLIEADRFVWVAALEREYDNLRAALHQAPSNALPDAGLRLGGALWWFWFYRGLWSEGRERLTSLMFSGESAEPPVYARALLGAGVLSWAQGDHPTAHRLLEACVTLSHNIGEEACLAYALMFLAQELLGSEDVARARSLAVESVRLFRKLGDPSGKALSVTSLGVVLLFQGDLDAAETLLEDGANEARACNDAWALALPLRNLGYLAGRRGDLETAVARYRESLSTLRQVGEKWFVSRSLELLAITTAWQGRYERAACLFGASEALREAVGAAVLPYYQAEYERGLEALRNGLDESRLRASWTAGRALSHEQAIAFALEEPAGSEAEPEAGSARAAAGAPPELRIHAFGPLEVYRDGSLITSGEWRFAKPRELLCYLLCHPSRRKDQIGLALWPEASAAQFRNGFHVTLHQLRRTLGRSAWVLFQEGAYRFNRTLPYWFDVEIFEARLTEAHTIRNHLPADAVSLLEEAVTLYREDFLEGFPAGDWFVQRREQLRQRFLEALLLLGDLLLAADRPSEAVDKYRQAALFDSYSEAAHRALMRGYARLGEHGQLHRHYHALVELLRDELGLTPSPETTQLFHDLQAGKFSA